MKNCNNFYDCTTNPNLRYTPGLPFPLKRETFGSVLGHLVAIGLALGLMIYSIYLAVRLLELTYLSKRKGKGKVQREKIAVSPMSEYAYSKESWIVYDSNSST